VQLPVVWGAQVDLPKPKGKVPGPAKQYKIGRELRKERDAEGRGPFGKMTIEV
jgi:hypothetical protein